MTLRSTWFYQLVYADGFPTSRHITYGDQGLRAHLLCPNGDHEYDYGYLLFWNSLNFILSREDSLFRNVISLDYEITVYLKPISSSAAQTGYLRRLQRLLQYSPENKSLFDIAVRYNHKSGAYRNIH